MNMLLKAIHAHGSNYFIPLYLTMLKCSRVLMLFSTVISLIFCESDTLKGKESVLQNSISRFDSSSPAVYQNEKSQTDTYNTFLII